MKFLNFCLLAFFYAFAEAMSTIAYNITSPMRPNEMSTSKYNVTTSISPSKLQQTVLFSVSYERLKVTDRFSDFANDEERNITNVTAEEGSGTETTLPGTMPHHKKRNHIHRIKKLGEYEDESLLKDLTVIPVVVKDSNVTNSGKFGCSENKCILITVTAVLLIVQYFCAFL